MSTLDAAVFVAGFALVHTVAYTVAGVVELRVADGLYGGADRTVDFLRDVSDPAASGHISRAFLPAQLVRGALMAVVLVPLLEPIAGLSLTVRVAFLAGLMFVYTDLASAVPFQNTIEGLVYLEPEYVQLDTFLAVQFEAVLYSLLFGLAAGWLLF